MPNPIRPKRSFTPNAVPNPATDIDGAGEMLVNWADGKFYSKDGSGNLITLTASGGGGGLSWESAPASTSSSGAVGSIAYDSGYLYVCVGASNWKRVALSAFAEDQYWANVSLLMRGDGSGSSFVDSSSVGRTLTAYGNATQSTTHSKWGGKSAYFDGSGDYVEAANSADFNFGSGDWCVEFWMYASSQALAPLVHQTSLADEDGWVIWNYDNVSANNTTRKLTLMLNGATFILTSSGDCYADNTWTHIAVTRSGNTISMYAGGTRVATDTFSGSISDASTPLQVGGIISGTSWNGTLYYAGYIDDLRITKGQDRGYTGSSISVPTAAFPNT